MSDDEDDWKKKMKEASVAAQEHADGLADGQLEEISDQTKQLTEIFSNLELSDEANYQALVAIVDDATRRNQSIGEIVERFRAVGAAAEEVVGVIESLTPAGALSALGKALKR